MYLEHYGLQYLPFQITPDVRFFFESQGHSRARATIIYGLSKNEGFVVVTGAVGAGKTTLLEHLLAGGRFDDAVVARINTTQLGAENLLELIAYRLGLAQLAATKAGLLRDLESFLLATRAEGKRTLLIVDEVQNLSTEALEELRMLSNFQDAENPLLQTLLVGQPEFRQRLAQRDTEQIRQRVIASYHLAPLALADVPAYIAFRLKHAGYVGLPIFTPDALAEIAKETGGVPRKINRLCDRALLYGFLEARHELDGAAIAEVSQEMRVESLEADAPERKPAEADPAAGAQISAAVADRANVWQEPLELVDAVEPEAVAPAPSPEAEPTTAAASVPPAPAATAVGDPPAPEPGCRTAPPKPVLITMNGQPQAASVPAPGDRTAGADPAELTATVAALRAELSDYKSKIARILERLGPDGADDDAPLTDRQERR